MRDPSSLSLESKEETPMKHLCVFLFVFYCCLISLSTASAQQQKTHSPRRPKASQPSPKSTQTPKVSKSKPVRLLVRTVGTTRVAADGLVFMYSLGTVEYQIEKTNPEVRENIQLFSGGSIEVEQESVGETEIMTMEQKHEPIKWKKDPAGYDFLIIWAIEQHERSKYSLWDKLQIDVKETWKAEKVSDPTVTQTWETTYVLTDTGMGYSNESQTRGATELIKTVISPARGPILKEIRAFIMANKTASLQF